MATRGSDLLLSIFLFVITFFYLQPTTATVDVASISAPAPTDSNANAVAFVHLCCHVARYSDVCFSSLSPYAKTINEDITQFARVALSLSANKGRGLASYIANLTGDGANSSITSALSSCSLNLDDVVNQIHDSVKLIRRINGDGNSVDLFGLQTSNMQMWMNTELTIADSCINKLAGMKDEAVKMEIEKEVAEFKKLTMNAITIVNSYAKKLQS